MFKIEHFPTGKTVKYDISKNGYFGYEEYSLSDSMKNIKVSLYPSIEIAGTVVDIDTGNPPKMFYVGFDYLGGGSGHGGRQDGYFQETIETSFDSDDYKKIFKKGLDISIKIKSKGYQTEEINEHVILGKDLSLDLEFELTKSFIQKGKVFDADGNPCEGVNIRITERNFGTWLMTEDIWDMAWDGEPRAVSDQDGSYSLQIPKKNSAIVFVDSKGIAVVDCKSLKEYPDIILQAWGSIEGQILQYGKPAPFVEVHYSVEFFKEKKINKSYSVNAVADKNGFFKMENIPSGKFELSYGKEFPYRRVSGVLNPGEHKKLNFSKNVFLVKAKLVPKGVKGIVFKDIYSNYDITVSADMVVPDKIPEGVDVPENWKQLGMNAKWRLFQKMSMKKYKNNEVGDQFDFFRYRSRGKISDSGEVIFQVPEAGIYSLDCRIGNHSQNIGYFQINKSNTIKDIGDLKFKIDKMLFWDKKAQMIKGIVVSSDGEVANHALIIVTQDWGNVVFPEDNYNSDNERTGRFLTNSRGEYEVRVPLDRNCKVAIVHKNGCAKFANFNKFAKAKTITLKKWGSVNGRFLYHGRPMQNVEVSLLSQSGINNFLNAKADNKGNFSFNYLYPGIVNLSFFLPAENKEGDYSFLRYVKIESGKSADITVNIKGGNVKGKIRLPDANTEDLEDDDLYMNLTLLLPNKLPLKESLPANWKSMTQKEKEKWFSGLCFNDKGQGILADKKYILSYPVSYDIKKLTFSINDVMPGTYCLELGFFDPDLYIKKVFSVSQTDSQTLRDIDLGELIFNLNNNE